MSAHFPHVWLTAWLMLHILHTIYAINKCEHGVRYRDLCPNPLSVSIPSISEHVKIKINITSSKNALCNFIIDDQENGDIIAEINGIHVTDTPWSFEKAADCHHIVELALGRPDYSMESKPVCEKRQGMKVQDKVYFWHNFSLSSDHISYADEIMHYDQSPSDVKCTHTSRPKFVLMAFVTSKEAKCSLLIQQYQLDGHRGCDYINGPRQTRFCGAYQCDEGNSILNQLKLDTRRPHVNSYGGRYDSDVSTIFPPHNPKENYPHLFLPTNQGESLDEVKPTELISTTSDPEEMKGEEFVEKEFDWTELTVRLTFPAIGVLCIVILLRIFKGRYPNEICGKPGRPLQYIHGSMISMDKEGLNI